MLPTIVRLLIVFSIGLALLGQKPGGGSPGPGPGTKGTGPATTGPSTTPNNNPNFPSRSTTQNPTFNQQPIYISGKVVLDDGTPPPEEVVIQRVCNGRIRPEGYTDSHGRFSIDLMKSDPTVIDASTETGISNRGSFGGGRNGSPTTMLYGCELQASLPGFRSDVVNLSNIRPLDNPDVGSIILHRLASVQGLTISATSLLAPKDAQKAYEKGRKAIAKQKWADAQKDLSKAVGIYPKYATAWYQLGFAQEEGHDVAAARKSYASALAADSKLVTPYLRLAALASNDKQWQNAADYSNQLIHLNPVDFPVAYLYNCIANYELQKFDAAGQSATGGIKADKEHKYPKFEHVLGLVLANGKDYPGALTHLKAYLAAAPESPDAKLVRQQIAQIESVVAQNQPAKN